MRKTKSLKATGLLMVYRDELKAQAEALRASAEQAYQIAEQQAKELIQAAKQNRHEHILQANRLMKQASQVQEALQEDLEIEVRDNQQAISDWNLKSPEHVMRELQLLEADEAV